MRRGRGRAKLTWVEVVKNDMSIKEETESMTSNRIEWWKTIHWLDSYKN